MTQQTGLKTRLVELAVLFARIGATTFGGPAAHMAIMEDEVVRRRKWLTREEFLDLWGATNLIPGPNSTEMALHIGRLRAGWIGLVVSGLCFIVPAVAIVAAIAYGYVQYERLPQVQGVLYGVKPVVITIVVQALWALGQTAIKGPIAVVLCVCAMIATIAGVTELKLLFASGTILAFLKWFTSTGKKATQAPLVLGMVAACVALFTLQFGTTGNKNVEFGLMPMFWYFVKIGSVLYGSGYVLLAFLRDDLVESWQWITVSQLLDATAVGQVTPGPMFSTATFIGYLLGGFPGALVATAGIFLPAFAFVAISGPLIPHIRKSLTFGAFLDGVIVASLALMAVVSFELGRASLLDVPTVAIAAVSAVLLFRYRVNSLYLIAGGALVGLAFYGRLGTS